VKHSPEKTHSRALRLKILARGRQWQSEVSTLNAPCAILSASAKKVKSFLRVCSKLNQKAQVSWRQSASAKSK
tara:strand:+ start:278 stop:496 length:219 start_codon:yes stop_codon:yes gene_type:complete